MAPRIKAINAYRPRIEQGNTVQKAELVRTLSRATGLVEGSIAQANMELRDHIIEFNRAGRAVKVDGLGTFSPSINLDGTLFINFRADPALNHGINVPGTFTGTIINREYIGKTSDQLVTLWNSEHPTELVPVTG